MLIGNPAKAKRQLGWEPKVRFKELVKIMVEADVQLLRMNDVRQFGSELITAQS